MARRGGVSVAATYALVQNLRGDCSFEFDIESQGASEGSLEAIMATLGPELFVMSSEEGQASTDKLWAPEVSSMTSSGPAQSCLRPPIVAKTRTMCALPE